MEIVAVRVDLPTWNPVGSLGYISLYHSLVIWSCTTISRTLEITYKFDAGL
jgi:hypothetical protein